MILNDFDLRINGHAVFGILAVFIFLISQVFIVNAFTAPGYTKLDMVRMFLEKDYKSEIDTLNQCNGACKAFGSFEERQDCYKNCARDTKDALFGSVLAYCEYLASYLADPNVQNTLSMNELGISIGGIAPSPLTELDGEGRVLAPLLPTKDARDDYGIFVPANFYSRYVDLISQGLLVIIKVSEGTIDEVVTTPEYLNRYEECLKKSNQFLSEIEKKSERESSASQPAISESQSVIPEVLSDVQEQGNLAEWDEKLREETGADSDVSKTLDECERQKQDIINKCQGSPEGWSVIAEVSINDLKSGKNYDFQEARTGGCKKSRKFREPFKVNITSRTLSASESQQMPISREHQVSCSLLCSSWNCEDTYLALVESYKGNVSVIRNGKTMPISGKPFIQEGDVIVTGADGMLAFKLVGEYNEATGKFNDNDIVEVMPNSRLNIIDPETGADLIYGNAKVHIEKGSNRKYSIRTLAARVVAKGTDYVVSVDPYDGKTNVYLSNGSLQIVQLSTNEAIIINSNEKVSVGNQALGAPVRMAAGEWEALVKDIMPAGKTPSLKNSLLAVFIISFIVWALIEIMRHARRKKLK